MFALHETTRRRLCRAGFVLLCVVPTLCVAGWAAGCGGPSIATCGPRTGASGSAWR